MCARQPALPPTYFPKPEAFSHLFFTKTPPRPLAIFFFQPRPQKEWLDEFFGLISILENVRRGHLHQYC